MIKKFKLTFYFTCLLLLHLKVLSLATKNLDLEIDYKSMAFYIFTVFQVNYNWCLTEQKVFRQMQTQLNKQINAD